MNVDQVKAGRETDALVAEVMGWKHHVCGNWPWQMVPPESDSTLATDDPAFVVMNVPKYSTDTIAMFELLETLRTQGIYTHLDNAIPSKWDVYLNNERRGGWDTEGCWDERVAEAMADTAPLAVCRAVLKISQCQSPL
jgi:hypothetical protein